MTTTTQAEAAPATSTRSSTFVRFGVVAYLAAVGAAVVAIWVWLDGTFIYVLDDAAIHLSIADTLVHHGTWGVAAGSFESASSSPVWTLLVAAATVVAPMGDHWVPLVLNVVAGVAAVTILGWRYRTSELPQLRRLDAAVAAVAAVLVLFLPGLAITGMEHTLHIALVLGVIALFDLQAGGDPRVDLVPRWLPYLLLVVATLTRFETLFVGAGLVVALACESLANGQNPLLQRWRQMLAVALAVSLPAAGFALVNMAMGGGFLPNSVLAKGRGAGAYNHLSGGYGPAAVLGRLTRDPVVAVVVVVAAGYVVLTWRRLAPQRLVAVTLLVTVGLHLLLADVGWFQRYQAYLIAIGLYLVLGLIASLPPELRRRGTAALLVAGLVLTPIKANTLARGPGWADAMYRHQYQAGLFLERYYDGQPVATDQLGYISLFHDGPLTDFAGLGDYEVLQQMPEELAAWPAFWESLAEARGFRVAVVHAQVAVARVPKTWVLAGDLSLTGSDVKVTPFQFWATTPDEVSALQAHLREFASELPDRVELHINDWAEMQAAKVRETRGDQRPSS